MLYDGEWKDGEWIHGILVKNQGEWEYEGPFVKNIPHGKGRVTINGNHFESDVFGGINFGN